MSESSDDNDFDRLEQQLRWTLSKVERDVQDAVRRVGEGGDAEHLMERLDDDVEELEAALGGLRSELRRSVSTQPIALHLAVAVALDRVLGQLEIPLAITSRVPADLPTPAMPRADLTSLCERALSLVTRVAAAGDELRILAGDEACGEGELVGLEIELAPFEPARLTRVLEELRRSSESLVDFVGDHGGRLTLDPDGAARIRVGLPRLVPRV